MISGLEYNAMCKWHVCPRYNQVFDSSLVEENDMVFLNLDYFEGFMNHILTNKPKNKFILVTQNSDRDFTKNMHDLILPFVNKIYAINASFQSPFLIKTPLGFNDQSMNEIIKIEHQEEKPNLIYLNFRVGHHHERPICFDYFKNLDWVDIETKMNGLERPSATDFYNILKTYKYCISPRGAGIDTHRNYECFYLGVIPIVKRNELTDLYEKMPILLVDNWAEITKEFLENSYEKLKSNLDNWLDTNKDWSKAKYWIN